MELGPVWLVIGVGLLAALLGQRRLPRGQPEGLFVAALSAALLLLYLPWFELAEVDPRYGLAGGLMALSVLWFVAARWVERVADQRGDPAALDAHVLRRRVAGHAALATGLAAAGIVLTAAWDTGERDPLLAAVLLPLLIVAGAAAHRRRTAMAWHGPAGVALLGLALLLPRDELAARRGTIASAQFLAAVVLLGVFLLTVLAHWRWRSAVARQNPAALARRPPRHVRTYGLVIAGAITVGLSAVFASPGVLTPVALFLGALGALGIGHRWHSNAIGELGMLLVGMAIVIAGPAWLPGGRVAALVGWSVAGVYLLWLARFWDQQRLDGVPWTTTGRLVPIVRRLGHVAAAAAFGWAVALHVARAAGVTPWPIAAMSVLVLLLYVSMLVRDAERGHAGAVPLAVLVTLAALVPLAALAARLGWSWPPAVWLAAAGLLLTLRAGGVRREPQACFWAAHLGGILPLVTFVLLAYGRTWTHNPAAAVVSVCGVVLMLGYWALRKPRVRS